jgi:hypothetical protein
VGIEAVEEPSELAAERLIVVHRSRLLAIVGR